MCRWWSCGNERVGAGCASGHGRHGVARCWRLTRRDGVVFGFTDHDCDLVLRRHDLSGRHGPECAALSQTTGLAVDNGEAVGALSDASVTEADIAAGRFDGAEVEAWLVQWADARKPRLQFRGSIGEVSRARALSPPSCAGWPRR
jgi:uncharacterized phage protein (TIGR02218 family)